MRTFIECLLNAKHIILFIMYVNSFSLQHYERENLIVIYLKLKEIAFCAQDHTVKDS